MDLCPPISVLTRLKASLLLLIPCQLIFNSRAFHLRIFYYMFISWLNINLNFNSFFGLRQIKHFHHFQHHELSFVVVKRPPSKLPVFTWLGIWLRLSSLYCSASSENFRTLKFMRCSCFTSFDWVATFILVFIDPEEIVLDKLRFIGPRLSS